MKQKWHFFWLIGLLLLITACGRNAGEAPQNTASAYEKIQKRLVALQSYQSEATVSYKSNKGTNVYDTLQQCTIEGKYRVEVTGPKNVSGNVTVSDGKTIMQYNPKVSGKVSLGMKENPERAEIFLTSFIKNYLSSQEVSVSVGNFGEGKCTVLEAIIPGNHPYMASEKLWVDNKTLNPVKLVIYDPDMGERIVVNFKTFEYNVPLEENLFTISASR